MGSDFYEPNLDYDNVDWFADEVKILENKMTFYFGNTEKDIIMTKENEERYRSNNVCRFCEKEIICDKVTDYCHLTVKTEHQHKANVIKMSYRNRVNLFHLLLKINLVIFQVKSF